MELLRALACLAEPPDDESAELAVLLDLDEPPSGEAWHDLFVLQLVPYASVYLGAEGMLGGEARDRIAGTWRALGLTPPDEPDHLTVLLSAYASLRDDPPSSDEAEPAARTRQRREHLARVFFWEHLMSWLPAYLRRAGQLSSGSYRRWAALLAEALAAEARRIPPPPEPPPALREAPSLADPRQDGGERFVATVLAPVVSGFILTRADLAHLAAELDLGNRRGERAFILKALLSQDGPATLAWLATEARRQAAGHRADVALSGVLAQAWERRAEASAALLDELAESLAASDPASEPASGEPTPQPITPEASP